MTEMFMRFHKKNNSTLTLFLNLSMSTCRSDLELPEPSTITVKHCSLKGSNLFVKVVPVSVFSNINIKIKFPFICILHI